MITGGTLINLLLVAAGVLLLAKISSNARFSSKSHRISLGLFLSSRSSVSLNVLKNFRKT